jgi:hypothetical protein
MSDNWIVVIPESADFVPSEEAQRKAIDLLKRLAPKSEEVTAEATPKIRFFDCGENLTHVICPTCGKDLDIYWWQDRMEEEAKAGYPLHLIDMPCCHAKHRVDELQYDWPQGFARFSVEAMNPDIADLSENEMNEFELLLGCKVRKILQHI